MSVFKPKYRGKGKPSTSRKWVVQFKDHRDTWRRIPGFTDKKLTEEFDRKLRKLVECRSNREPLGDLLPWVEGLPRETKLRLVRFELLQSTAAEGIKPTLEHVADYRRFLESANRSERYVIETTARVESIVNNCRFTFLSDISAAKVSDNLKRRRDADMGIKTSNHYLSAMKIFCNWLVSERRITDSPIRHLKKLNAETDVRRIRRHLSQDDFSKLIEAAENGGKAVGLTGTERATLYLTAAYTGLRAAELGSLTEQSLDFKSDPPTITVEAAYSKHRRKDVLPLHPELASRLYEWITTRDDGGNVVSITGNSSKRLWDCGWASSRRGAEMLRVDLEPAGIPYYDESGEVFDFHSLRHQFISMLAASGVHVKMAQELARHSDINLTMNTYTHVGLHDLNSAVETLPAFPSREAGSLQKTGTDDQIPTHKPTHKLSPHSVVPEFTFLPTKGNNRRHPRAAKTPENTGENGDSQGKHRVKSTGGGRTTVKAKSQIRIPVNMSHQGFIIFYFEKQEPE